MIQSRTTIALAALVFATGAPYVFPSLASAADHPGIVAVGDFETGDFSQWWTVYNPQRASIVTSSSLVRQGQYAAKFVVEDGDQYNQTAGERVEVSTLGDMRHRNGPDNRAGEGDEYYYAWSTYVPQDFPGVVNWGPSFANWHSEMGGTRAPVSFKLMPNQNQIWVETCGGHGSADDKNLSDLVHYYTIISDLQRGAWIDFVMHTRWTVEDTGAIEVWYKYADDDAYTKALDKHNIPTLQQSPHWNGGDIMQVYQKMGLYRSASEKPTAVIYQDGMVVGTTFEAVSEWAHGTSPVPEPASAAILLLTGGGLMFKRPRKSAAGGLRRRAVGQRQPRRCAVSLRIAK